MQEQEWMSRWRRVGFGISALLGVLDISRVSAAEPLKLGLPLACEPRKSCFIQNFVDLDSGAGVRDFACGGATYNGHTGVDFRVLSAAATASGVPVLATADGVVKGRRDGVADIFIRDNKSGDTKGRECGNGVLIDHGAGWETQYCHLKQGSIGVAIGQSVKQGDRLGDVGFSGMADFAHVHLSVRHDGKVVDPFLPDAAVDAGGVACRKDAKAVGLWRPDIAAKLAYQRGEIIGAGFAGVPPNLDLLEADHAKIAPVTPTSAALVFYGRFINVLAGDRIRVVITGPGGGLTEELSAPLERNKATFMTFAGKKRRDSPWPLGQYEGRVEIVRGGAVIATRVSDVKIEPDR